MQLGIEVWTTTDQYLGSRSLYIFSDLDDLKLRSNKRVQIPSESHPLQQIRIALCFGLLQLLRLGTCLRMFVWT